MSIIRVGIEENKNHEYHPTERIPERVCDKLHHLHSHNLLSVLMSKLVETGASSRALSSKQALALFPASLVHRLSLPPVCEERAQEQGLLDRVPCYLEYGMVWVPDRYPVQHGKGYIGDHGLLHGYSWYPYVSSDGGRRRNGRSTCVYAKRR